MDVVKGPPGTKGNVPPEGVPRVGDTIAGKYRVERILGVGGMGVVVAAQHTQLGHPVAIKFLLPEALAAEEAVPRFLREARSAVRIQSEHVVRIMDVDTLESGAPYVVMELLSGSDLQQVVTARGPLPVPEAVDYVLQACEAIAEAHALGIVHRDLKPANLFLGQHADGAPLVKVLDFGISKAVQVEGGTNRALTSTKAIMGSPQYMSPEQVRSSRNVDARTDIWALGVILHQLVTGAAPFEDDTLLGLCAKILTEPPAPLRTLRPDAPPELEAVVMACLEKDVNQRLQNVGALARALSPFAPGSAARVERIARVVGLAPLAVPAEPSGRIAIPAPTPVGLTDPGASAPSAPARRRVVVAAVAAAGVIAVAAVAFVLWGRAGRPEAGDVPGRTTTVARPGAERAAAGGTEGAPPRPAPVAADAGAGPGSGSTAVAPRAPQADGGTSGSPEATKAASAAAEGARARTAPRKGVRARAHGHRASPRATPAAAEPRKAATTPAPDPLEGRKASKPKKRGVDLDDALDDRK